MAAADTLFRERRTNALVGWILVAVFVVTAVEEFVTGDLIWAGFAAVVAVLIVLPAVRHRDPEVMPPWEVLVLAALPIIGRAVATLELTSALATYLAVAAVALLIAVEIDAFTPVRMTIGFAIVFVVVATMAAAALWALARGAFDWWFGTALLPGEKTLGWEFVYSTAAGVIAGVIFEFYFRRRASVDERIPDDIVEDIEEELEELVHHERREGETR